MNMLVPHMMDRGRLARYEPEQKESVPNESPRLKLITDHFGRALPFSNASENICNNYKWEAHTDNIADTLAHQKDTAEKALALATIYFPELSPLQRSVLYCAAMYHDAGKFEIKPEIMFKPDNLTQAEYRIVQKHVQLSSAITGKMEIKDFNLLIASYNDANPEQPLVALPDTRHLVDEIADLVLSHHEHCDGKGYPRQIVEKDLSLLARIITVADVYDALTRNRDYRDVKTEANAKTASRQTTQKPNEKRKAFTPDEAITMMLGQGAEKFDITVLACLHHMVLGPETPQHPAARRATQHTPQPALVLGG